MKSLVIEKNDLIYNINQIKKYNNENCKIIAVVKGNGYGLGLIEFSKLLVSQGIDYLAVSTVEEAIELKQSGIEAEVLLLSSVCNRLEVQTLVDNGVILTVGSTLSAQVANEFNARVHVKIDTGFGRYGFLYNKEKDILDLYKDYPNLKIEGTFSHFAQSYAKDETYTKLQFDRFISVIEMLKMNDIEPGMLHICNSTAFLKYPLMHLNAVRIGSAFLGRILTENNLGLRKIAHLETEIIETKLLPKGHNVGYSCSAKTKRETKIAIVPVGYYDGFNVTGANDMFRFVDRLRDFKGALKNLIKKGKITVKVNGKECNVMGQIGMCHTAIDITDIDAKAGDKVIMDVNPIHIQTSLRREWNTDGGKQ